MTRGALGPWVRRVAPILLFIVLAVGMSSQPVAASDPISLIISNVRDSSFAVSWLTSAEETGQVQVVGGATFDDDRGAEYVGLTHYVTVSGMEPSTDYRFDLISGGSHYDGDGAHYSVVTGPTLTPPSPDLVVGRVKRADGSAAANVVVVFNIQQEQNVSAPVSMLLTARDRGMFHVNLSDVRALQDPTRYFTYGGQTDLLTIQAGDARGTGMLRVPVSDPRLRSNDPNQTVVVEMSSPGEATPTLIVRLPTTTPVPAASPAETSGLIVGLGTAVLVVIGMIAIALLFVWRNT